MPSLKAIRRRISSVKGTQKITRAMKMVAGARLARAQQRILALRPYAVRTSAMLDHVTKALAEDEAAGIEHPLLVGRPERRALILVITSDRGQCGAFNTNIARAAERLWREKEAAGVEVRVATIGRKGRDYFTRRKANVFHAFTGVWEKLDIETARHVVRTLMLPFVNEEFDAIYLVYNEFKSAMSQKVTVAPLLPLAKDTEAAPNPDAPEWDRTVQYLFEPDKDTILERLVPLYLEATIARALLESMASELGARMTAMDSATKNASEMISKLTLVYNRARQAAITTELMEIIGGAEALRE
ncbi:MAG TPA: ATP synthase F1 subunit gamma [Polyangiaceae bacterium]|jgi:F-type H+-transporting ATPase subunit gamma|nr:ATP synthase F1 subunit gamma [Polyangiaceae bacterium]